MYHVRRADGEERSMYADSLAGVEAAVNEAVFRTKHTGHDHVVYDDVQGKVIHTINCDRRQVTSEITCVNDEPPPVPKKNSSWFEWMLIGGLMALLFSRMWGHG